MGPHWANIGKTNHVLDKKKITFNLSIFFLYFILNFDLSKLTLVKSKN